MYFSERNQKTNLTEIGNSLFGYNFGYTKKFIFIAK